MPRGRWLSACALLAAAACSAPSHDARMGAPIMPAPSVDSGTPLRFDASVPPPFDAGLVMHDAGEDAAEPPPEPLVIDECGMGNPANLTTQQVALLTPATD